MAPLAATSGQAIEISDAVRAYCRRCYVHCGAASYEISEEQVAAWVAEVWVKAQVAPGDADAFFSALKINELVLARACESGNERAWTHFMSEYREVLYGAAYKIAGEESQARELADSIYGELYGVNRTAKLRYYSGRGSLAGWLRTVVAQEYVNRYRKQRREEPLERLREVPAEDERPMPVCDRRMEEAVEGALQALDPEEQMMIAAYYLDGRTLAQIAQVMGVHESTVSRRIERSGRELCKRVEKGLVERGFRKSEAREMMERLDVRDLRVRVRESLRQDGTAAAFSKKEQG